MNHQSHYCIYSDKHLPADQGNIDHIIPLSLGGRDQFTVWAKSSFNAEMGTKVDAPIANDFAVQMRRLKHGVKGHSGPTPPHRWTKSTIAGRPGQVVWTDKGARLWDARERRFIEDELTEPTRIQTSSTLDFYAPTRFIAKVALGGGYFLYGDEFRNAVDCGALRKLIALDAEKARNDSHLMDCGISICDRLHPDLHKGPEETYKALCELWDRTIFIAVPHETAITFAVGVLGHCLGAMIVPANTKALPVGPGEHDLGDCILLGPGPMERVSFRELAGAAAERMRGSREGDDES